jgi:hypothetical protein
MKRRNGDNLFLAELDTATVASKVCGAASYVRLCHIHASHRVVGWKPQVCAASLQENFSEPIQASV